MMSGLTAMDNGSWESKEKIIFIGLSKMGTTSLHRLLSDSGIKSAHWKISARRVFLAKKMFSNFSAGKPLLDGTGRCHAYSELSYVGNGLYLEGSILFRELYRDYPNSYFILNTRNKEKWILSRRNHHSRHGKLVDRAKQALDVDDDDELTGLWSRFYDEHHKNVRSFFEDKSGTFLEFNIEQDSPQKIADFLRPTYAVDLNNWQVYNSTKAKRRRRAAK